MLAVVLELEAKVRSESIDETEANEVGRDWWVRWVESSQVEVWGGQRRLR
jgi:hypothetical protein